MCSLSTSAITLLEEFHVIILGSSKQGRMEEREPILIPRSKHPLRVWCFI